MGMVTVKKFGIKKRTTSITVLDVELLRTTISRMFCNSRMNRMKVKSAHPIRE
jgi:hypothetical protein